MSSTSVIRSEFADGVTVITLNRPETRNALSSELLAALSPGPDRCRRRRPGPGHGPHRRRPGLLRRPRSEGTGFDRVQPGQRRGPDRDPRSGPRSPWPVMTKPVIGAINGPAVTGGLELALQCDFLIASERARFADTHARVGVMPGWGLTVLLPQAIGLRRAKEMSLTGNYMDAAEALAVGLVNRIVAHDELLPTAVALAATSSPTTPNGVATLLASYKETALTTAAEGLLIEHRAHCAWRQRQFDPAEVERRRAR